MMSVQRVNYEEELLFQSPGLGHWSNQKLSSGDWESPQWQLRNRLQSLSQIEQYLTLSPKERTGLLLTGTKLATAITPYFFNLIEPQNEHCPIRKQVIPHEGESIIGVDEFKDPCGEDAHMPVPGLVHRYPDRVLFLVTDRCASYCRYCTRSRVVSGVSEQKLETQWDAAIEYLKKTPSVRDVLLSGGDPFLLSDQKLEKLLEQIHAIPHIQFIRIGSRIPVFLPQRITPELGKMLSKFQPLFVSVHVNHPRELTLEVKKAMETLSDSGISLGNQSVLLKGINDNPVTQKALVHKLLMCRVRPYYLYQCDLIQGSAHLRVPIETGLNIIEQLRGHTSGYAVPQYVIDAPGGGGKIPINPQYMIHQDSDQVELRNFEQKRFVYPQINEKSQASERPC